MVDEERQEPTIGPGPSDADVALGQTVGKTFDEWKAAVPAVRRAALYVDMAMSLWTSQWAVSMGMVNEPLVGDDVVEFLGQAYFDDHTVFQEAGYPELEGVPEVKSSGRVGNFMLTSQQLAEKGAAFDLDPNFMGRPIDHWGEVLVGPGESFRTFYADVLAEGDPGNGIDGDPSLMNFIEGEGFLSMSYPTRETVYGFLKNEAVFLAAAAATAAVPATTAAGVTLGGTTKLAAGVAAGSKGAQALMSTARFLGWPAAKLFQLWVRMSQSKPFLGVATGVLGAGVFKLIDESTNPAIVQELQSIAVQAHEEALAEGNISEALGIEQAASTHGLDPEGALVGAASEARLDQALTGRTGGDLEVSSGGFRTTLSDEAGTGKPELPGTGGLPPEIRARFDRTPRTALAPGSMSIGQDPYEIDPKLGEFDPDYAPLHGVPEDYTRERWVVPVNKEQEHFLSINFPGTDETEQAERAAIMAGEPIIRTPIWRQNDWHTYLSKLMPAELVSLQEDLVVGNWMAPGLNGNTPAHPGQIDAGTVTAMSNVMWMMNQEAITTDPANWVSAQASGTLSRGQSQTQSRGGGRRSRAPFYREAYVAPDYDTLSQRAKQQARRALGRDLNQAEIQILADKMGEDDRAAFEVRQKARRAEYDAAGRGGDAGFVGETVDVEASFLEFFDEKYAGEIQRGQDVEQVYNSTRNLFGGLNNAAELIGR